MTPYCCLPQVRAVCGLGAGDAAFAEALNEVCNSLARQIVADGEGVSHVVELQINGAANDADALRVAKAIAHSPLVKTAWAGCDPNWGRLAAAIGYSGAEIDPDRFDIDFGDLPICRNGGRAPEFDEAAAHGYISQREFTDFDPAQPGNRLVRLLDDGPDDAVHPHQCGLFHVVLAGLSR